MVVECKRGALVNTNFDKFAKNVEAILINPNWNTTGKKPAKPDGTITVEDFEKL
jgi:hypothetical protein